MTGNKNISTEKVDGKFLTYDLGLAAALATLGYSLISINRIEEKRSQFIFQRDEHIDKMIDDYWEDKLTLPIRSYYDSYRMIKNRIYSVDE